MNNFKRIVALVVMYIMTILMLPLGDINVSATENIPQYLDINDIYINSLSQYKNKALVTYEKDENQILSLFTNGNEKIIKEFKTKELHNQYFTIKNNEDTAYITQRLFNYMNFTEEYYYYSFNFNTETLIEITSNEIPSIVDNNISYSEVNDNTIKNTVVEKINNKFGTNYTLYSEETPDGNTDVYLTKVTINNGEPLYVYTAYAIYGYTAEQYLGLYSDNFELLFEGYHNYDSYIDDDSGYYFVQENPYSNDSKLHVIYDAKLIGSYDVDSDFSLYGIKYINNKIYERDFYNNLYNIFSIEDKKLVLSNSIPMLNGLLNIPIDKDGNIWTVFDKDSKRYIAKVENDQAIIKYEIPFFSSDGSMDSLNMDVYDENNIVISSYISKSIFIQNETIEIPDTPSDEESNKPEDSTKPAQLLTGRSGIGSQPRHDAPHRGTGL